MSLGLEIGFDRPWFLLLLLLVPVLWVLSFRSLAGLGRWRRLFALLLRTSVLVVLVLALAQMQWRDRTDRLTVIYLLDQSQSIPAAKRDFMLEYVHRAVNDQRRDQAQDMAGVIVFGSNAKIESAPFDGDLPLIGRLESSHDLKTNATSLEAAMKLAKASFPEDTARRIVLITDGNENVGDALSMAQSLVQDGTGIDVVPVNLFSKSEIAVDKIVLPSDIRRGQEFEAKIVVTNDTQQDPAQGEGQVRGKLRLTQKTAQREELVVEQDVVLDPGKNVFPFVHKVERTDVFTFDATFVPEDPASDVITQNNTASAFAHVRGKGRVLLIEDGNHRGEFIQLVERLQSNNIEVDVMPSTSLFTSSAELLQYDSVVLANVPRATGETADEAEAFSDAQVRMLVRNCEEMGCGIVMIGGDRALGAGGWSNSELEKAMPVDFQIKNDKIDAVGALALMMHACEMPQGNFWQTKIAMVSIDVLGPMDYCGVIEWSDMGGSPRWLWKLPDGNGKPSGVARVFGNRKAMKSLVGRMVNGDMPDFNKPMQLTLNGLKNTRASLKHMIIISDGDPTPPTQRLLNDFVKNKIKISTVAVGTHGPAGSTPLKNIAQATGGKYYVAKNPRALPKIYQREARRVAKPVIKESKAGMKALAGGLSSSHEILQGINLDELPGFYGYVMTTVKKNPLVEQLLFSSDPQDNGENSTLLATWRYGVGRATVFTSDAGLVWTSDWFNSPVYEKLFSQMIRHSMRPITENANFSIATELKNNRGRIVVTALDNEEEFLNFLNVSARGIDPDLKSFGLDFSQVGPGRYIAEFDVEEAGNYLFSIFPGEGYERLTTGVNVPYSSEYTDRESNVALLQSMVGLKPKGGDAGELIEGEMDSAGLNDLLATNTFRPTLTQAIGIQDIWPWLLVVCGLVFFSDVFIRRVAVRFDWVGKMVSDWKAKGENQQMESRISRLQSRKAEIEKEISSRRAATRFSPDPESTTSGRQELERVIGDEIDETADRRRPARRDRSLEVEKEEKSYTSRLLDAKRKAQEKQKRKDRPGSDPD
ncbi:MAG: VWA domain-containing protein [Mariniblastus sp.]|nr:VWA domain-containing protein [Mariniblastus sp.]